MWLQVLEICEMLGKIILSNTVYKKEEKALVNQRVGFVVQRWQITCRHSLEALR